MTDILQRLYDVLDGHNEPRDPGNPATIAVPIGMLYSAVCEIERLRSLAGAVSDGPSFRETTQGVSRRSNEPGFLDD